MIDRIKARIQSSINVKQALLADDHLQSLLLGLARDCLCALRNGGKVIFAGNGGSFADAQHLSAEFVSRFMFDRAPLASVALGTNSSALSAIGNDYGYEQVFSRELLAVAKSGDVFIPISTSGNSRNILEAVAIAQQIGLSVVGLTGCGGGDLSARCNCLCVAATETARIQEAHILLGHILCELVEEAYFQNSAISASNYLKVKINE